VYRKRTDDHRRRMTIYLPEDLSRRLRLYAAEKDQDYSLVLAEALDALLERKGVR
jgi:predicted transcriptional regulator